MRKNKGKNRINARKVFIVIAIIIAGIITGTAAFGYVYFNGEGGRSGGISSGSDNGENNFNGEKLDRRVSFLLIGADKRPGDTAYNADAIIVASVDPDTKLVSLLSIPRDTRVELAGSSFLKINAIPMLRGIPELMNVVTDLTGIPLDGYVLTNFEGFKSIIDTLGGITLYVEKDMYYVTGDKVDGVINLKQGEQRLTGAQALQYARFRNDAMADISRTARQQKVLKAVAKEMLQVGTLPKLPKLVPQLMKAVETNLSVMDIIKLSKVAAYFDGANIVSQTLPGSFVDFNGLSYWEVNRKQAKEIAQNLLMGITTDRIINNKVIDLLDPEIKSHITVPGGPTDPNSKKSSGYQDFIDQENSSGQEQNNSDDKRAEQNTGNNSTSNSSGREGNTNTEDSSSQDNTVQEGNVNTEDDSSQVNTGQEKNTNTKDSSDQDNTVQVGKTNKGDNSGQDGRV